MAVLASRHSLTRRITSTVATLAALVTAACSGEKAPVNPTLPGTGPAATFRPLAFTADVNLRTGVVNITAPNASTANAPTLSLGGVEAPALSLLGGEAVRLIPSNYQASAVGAFAPGLIRVTFDVVIENKLPGIRFITPTWPVSPAAGVILFPLENVVTTTPGGVTGGDGNDIIVEQPSYGRIVPSIDWNGTGAAGSGAPYSFFNDADCSLATSNDCFRWEAYDLEVLPAPATSSVRTIGFDIDPTVGQFRARMVVAADLAPAGAVLPGTINGTVTSPARGALSGVTVVVSGGATGTTSATGTYSITTVAPGTRTVSLSTLPAGCTAPAAQSVGVGSGSTNTVNFTVDCTGLPGTIAGIVTRSNDGSPLANVTVAASGGSSTTTSATGAYSLTGVAAGAGTLTVTGAPAECTPAPEAYTLSSGGSITENIVVTCSAPPTPGYQYNTSWVDLGGGQVAVDLRIDMRTFNRADIVDVTNNGSTGDPLTGAQLSFTYDATKLTFVEGIGTTAPNITAAPTVNGATPGTVSVLNGATTLRTGNVGIVRVVFQRVAGATGLVGTTTTITAASSRTGTTTLSIIANVINREGTFILP
ncbi:MAG: hypothetical protein ACKVS7_08765 [Gemmatimonadaceae bacterium]